MSITVNGEDAEPGCFIAGHHGQYGMDMVADVAEGFGLELDDNDDPRYWRVRNNDAMSDDENHRTYEEMVTASDYCMEWLNDHTDGGYWDWVDGEFFLVKTLDPSDALTDKSHPDLAVRRIIDVLINDGEPWDAETIELVASALIDSGYLPIWEEAFNA